MLLQVAVSPEVVLEVVLQVPIPDGPQVGVETPPDRETGAPPHLHLPGGRGLTCEGRRSGRAGGAAGLTCRVCGRENINKQQQ